MLLLPAVSGAVTCYVDYGSGADTNNGTSTGTPWKHAHDDANATGTAAATAPAAGDTIIFKGGVEYHGTITPGHNGSNGSPITFDGNSAGTWGTGNAVINLDNTATYGFNVRSRSYIDIKNFETKYANYGGDRGGSVLEPGRLSGIRCR